MHFFRWIGIALAVLVLAVVVVAIVARFLVGRLWKQWPIDAMNDGREVIRIPGKRYEREAIRVTDPELFWFLVRESRRK